MSKKPLRPMGEILLDLENILLECSRHGLQWGDVFGLVYTYLMIHLQCDREEYNDGTHPEFYYGPERKSK